MKEWIEKLKNFLKETQMEAKKVVWPDRKYVITATIIVLVIVFMVVFYVMFVDYFFAKFFAFFMRRG